MKKLQVIITTILITSFSYGQAELEFQRCYGGTGWDSIVNIIQTSDGGYLFTGGSGTNDGDVSEFHGGYSDAWVVKLDNEFEIEWERSIGGSDDELAYSAIESNDGEYIIVGYTYSEDGDFITNHGGTGHLDGWIAKLSTNGDMSWIKCYGGTSYDELIDIKELNNGDFIACGISESTDGDITFNNGESDAWVITIDSDGNIISQTTYGSINYELITRVEVVNDGFVFLGHSSCSTCEANGHHGSYDIWLFKTDISGIIQWEKYIGGSSEESPYSLTQTIGGGFLITGYTYSDDGDAAENSDNGHLWILKTDNFGNLEWNTRLGGLYADLSSAIEIENEGSLIVGSKYIGEPGFTDIWITKLNSSGNIEWEKTIGGDYFDRSTSIIKSSINEYIIVGASESSYGEIFSTHCATWCQSDGVLLKISTNNNISGYVFNDENENNIFDVAETGLNNQMIKLEPGPIYTFTNEEGYYYFDVVPGDYTITYMPNDYWISTGETNYEISVSDESELFDNNNFAANNTYTDTDAEIFMVSLTPPRANTEILYWLFIFNNASETIDGDLGLKFDPLLSHTESSGIPTIQSDSIVWNLVNFESGQIAYTTSTFQVPGVAYIGDTITNIAWISPNLTDTNPNDNYDTIQQVIICAYDPNDKQVSPIGYGDDHFITHGERLTYTIRFQNTGNDTAFNVVIKDTLDYNLDINTFNLEAYSHDLSCNIRENNVLVFTFSNILLPDSVVNEPGSHGFVQYSISPLPDLDDYTEVINQAYIYFDYNPAIETNITTNQYISIIPVNIPDRLLGHSKIDVYPNPAQNEIFIEVKDAGRKSIKIIDSYGKILIDNISYDNYIQQDISLLENGVYLIMINSAEGNYIGKIIKQN